MAETTFETPFPTPFAAVSSLAVLGIAAFAEMTILPATEFALLNSDPVYWGWRVPKGDGHPVMVLPGLFAGDGYLTPLRRWLRRVGYTAVPSGLDLNPGWSRRLVEQLGEIAEEQHERSGQRVTIIGHSMGGALARSVALRRPHAIRHVITLGSPLRIEAQRELGPEVRLSAIFSRNDLIVRHPYALATDAHARNVEVQGSHVGLAVNSEVYRYLASALR
jgi:pimeloyl-ACP methyl ester carboxylesterase